LALMRRLGRRISAPKPPLHALLRYFVQKYNSLQYGPSSTSDTSPSQPQNTEFDELPSNGNVDVLSHTPRSHCRFCRPQKNTTVTISNLQQELAALFLNAKRDGHVVEVAPDPTLPTKTQSV